MLAINNLCLEFKNKTVLNHLNLTVDDGSVLGILGKNGAGKTTLFECLFQIHRYKGEISFNKKLIKRSDIGYLETENYFYPYITGQEYLTYFGAAGYFGDISEKFNLPLDKFVQDYSHGMKKKLAIVGILYLDKPIIILDEPFNGVDYESVNLIYDIISELKSLGKTVLISSHIIETLFKTCDNIAIIENGAISNYIEKQKFTDLENYKF